jgi:hypothetical protein
MYNLTLHKNSRKHKNNEQKMLDISQKSASYQPKISQTKSITAGQNFCESEIPPKTEKDSFECKFCNKKFKHYQSLWKHEKFRCFDKNQLEEKLKESEQKYDKLLNLATTNAETMKENSKTIKKSMSVMNYALKHFNDAPAIGLLEDDQFDKMSRLLMYDDKGKKKTGKSIEEVIVFHHKQGTLSKILGDLIVKIYKKNNPKDQSAWSSDVTRLTFIVKDMMGNKKSKWVVDKKGIHFTETIIDPLMDKIKDLLINYNDACGSYIRNTGRRSKLDDSEELKIKEMLLFMQETNLTLLTIKLKKIHIEILKYVAPHFNLNVNNIDDICSDTSSCNSDS